MVHVHGRDVSERAAQIARVPAERRLLVPVDVGKHEAMALVADGTGQRLVAPFTFTLDRPGLAALVGRVERAVSGRGDVQVEIGVEAAGHYHRPVTASASLPGSWTLLELNPAHVTEQRHVLGKRGITHPSGPRPLRTLGRTVARPVIVPRRRTHRDVL